MMMLLALSMAPSSAMREPQMVVQLLFDGKPLQTTAPTVGRPISFAARSLATRKSP